MFNAWEPRIRKGAQLVNEPGAWAMSRLDTADPDGAAAFYGEVFGWTTEAFGPATMFRLPGYVGGEPEQPVSREVVAVMTPAEQGARWIVDFWVDDIDAAVARSEEGGGTTVAAPFDGAGRAPGRARRPRRRDLLDQPGAGPRRLTAPTAGGRIARNQRRRGRTCGRCARSWSSAVWCSDSRHRRWPTAPGWARRRW